MTRASLRTQFENRNLVSVVLRHDEILKQLMGGSADPTILSKFLAVAQKVLESNYLTSSDDATISGDWVFYGSLKRFGVAKDSSDQNFITRGDYNDWIRPTILKLDKLETTTLENFTHVLWTSTIDDEKYPQLQNVNSDVNFKDTVTFDKIPLVQGLRVVLEGQIGTFVTLDTPQTITGSKTFQGLTTVETLKIATKLESSGLSHFGNRPRLIGKFFPSTGAYSFGGDPRFEHDPVAPGQESTTAYSDFIDFEYFNRNALTGASNLTITGDWVFKKEPKQQYEGLNYPIINVKSLISELDKSYGVEYVNDPGNRGISIRTNLNDAEYKLKLIGLPMAANYWSPTDINRSHCLIVTNKEDVDKPFFMGFGSNETSYHIQEGGDYTVSHHPFIFTRLGQGTTRHYRSALNVVVTPTESEKDRVCDRSGRRIVPLETLTILDSQNRANNIWYTRIGHTQDYSQRLQNTAYTNILSMVERGSRTVRIHDFLTPSKKGSVYKYDLLYRYCGINAYSAAPTSITETTPMLDIMYFGISKNIEGVAFDTKLFRGEIPQNFSIYGPSSFSQTFSLPYLRIKRLYKNQDEGKDLERTLELWTDASSVLLNNQCDTTINQFNVKFNSTLKFNTFGLRIPQIYNKDPAHKTLEGLTIDFVRGFDNSNTIDAVGDVINRNAKGAIGGFESQKDSSAAGIARINFIPVEWNYSDKVYRKLEGQKPYKTKSEIDKTSRMQIGTLRLSIHKEGKDCLVTTPQGIPIFGVNKELNAYYYQLASLRSEFAKPKEGDEGALVGCVKMGVFDTVAYKNDYDYVETGAIEVNMDSAVGQATSIRVHEVIKEVKLYKGKRVVTWHKPKGRKTKTLKTKSIHCTQ